MARRLLMIRVAMDEHDIQSSPGDIIRDALTTAVLIVTAGLFFIAYFEPVTEPVA